MLPACTSTQKPYFVAYQTATAYTGDSQGAACKYFADVASVALLSVTDHTCSTSAGSWAIAKACEPLTATTTSSTTPAETYDYAALGAFWAFGFTGVMLLYFSSHVIGLVVKAVRDF